MLETYPAFLVGVGADETPAYAATLAERAGHIHFGTLVIPRTGAEAGAGLEGFGRALAHHVHRGRRVTRAGDQAAGTAHHFNALVDGGVAEDRVAAGTGGVVGGNAIEHEVVDGKAARIEQRAVAVIRLDGHAGRLLQHLGDRDEVEILDALAGEHGQRLRGLAQGQRQLGGGVGAIDLVALGALGHHHPVQFGGGRRTVLGKYRRGGAGERQGEGVPAQGARVRVLHAMTFLVQEREDGRGAGLAGLRKLSQSTMAPAPAASTPHQPTKPWATPQAAMLGARLAASAAAPSRRSRRRRGAAGA